MVYENRRSSSSWADWMSQSTIHKRNVARHQERTNLESHGYKTHQPLLPVTIRVWRQLFTSRPLAANRLRSFHLPIDDPAVDDNVTDDCEIDSTAIYHHDRNEDQPWSSNSSEYYNDEVVLTGSINHNTSSFVTSSSHSNLSFQSVLWTGLIATGIGSSIFSTTQIQRMLFPAPQIPHFAIPYASLVGTNGLHHQIATLPIQRILQHGSFVPKNSIVSPSSWTNAKPFRAPILLFVLCGYEVVSSAILGPRP